MVLKKFCVFIVVPVTQIYNIQDKMTTLPLSVAWF